ncbi:MAG TPA: lipoyl domain-containing protein [Candidatus Angelobacter sp.]|nr:lipoyl domain-containing protein [Candidatus Angelobacter sp.]
MSMEICMPHMSDEVDEGVLVAWFVQPGAAVNAGDLLAEVQVEKVSIEIRAPAAGRVKDLAVPAGAVISQGAVLMSLEERTGGDIAS